MRKNILIFVILITFLFCGCSNSQQEKSNIFNVIVSIQDNSRSIPDYSNWDCLLSVKNELEEIYSHCFPYEDMKIGKTVLLEKGKFVFNISILENNFEIGSRSYPVNIEQDMNVVIYVGDIDSVK